MSKQAFWMGREAAETFCRNNHDGEDRAGFLDRDVLGRHSARTVLDLERLNNGVFVSVAGRQATGVT